MQIKVVSQGAQTNGITNGKKLTKSLSEMPTGIVGTSDNLNNKLQRQVKQKLVYV